MKKEELESILRTKTQQETADYFGVHLATVKRFIKRYGILYNKKSGGHFEYKNKPLNPELKLTKQQSDIISGCLLGDGFILKTNVFRIKQKSTHQKYVEYLHRMFEYFVTPIRTDKARKPSRIEGKVSHRLEDWNGDYCYSTSFTTRKHPVFTALRQKWYPNDKKIVPSDLKLNEEVLTHWYLQDGCHNKQRNYYKFSTQSFSENEVENLCKLLNAKFGIQ